ncbi:MAG: ParA family protein [Firmicutes bacterium]|nr:ParA family protein [Bacillota bacterium]
MAQIITTAAIKGGTGKTATAGALAQAAAAAGKRVLAIDLDPQSNLSIWLKADLSRAGSYDILTGRADTAAAIQPTESGIDLLAGGANLSAIKTTPGSARRLEKALEPLAGQYDFTVIDTAPAMGELQNNALYASTGLIIPLETDSNSLQGLYQILDIAQHIQQSKPTLQILGVVITKYDSRPKINRFLHDTIKEKAAAAGAPFLAAISNSVSMREAMAMQQPLFEYAPKSRPAQDYKKLYQTIADQ